MKKKLSLIVLAAMAALMLSACGETTMDGGNDTDGMAGEPAATGSAANDAGNAVKDAAEGVGNAGRAVIDGAENAVNDMTGAMGNNASGR